MGFPRPQLPLAVTQNLVVAAKNLLPPSKEEKVSSLMKIN